MQDEIHSSDWARRRLRIVAVSFKTWVNPRLPFVSEE